MHEVAIAHVDRDVRRTFSVLIEKEEIALAQMIRRYRPGSLALALGAARYLYAGAGITVIDQTAAVETLRAVATVAVGFTQHADRRIPGFDGGSASSFFLGRRTTAGAEQSTCQQQPNDRQASPGEVERCWEQAPMSPPRWRKY